MPHKHPHTRTEELHIFMLPASPDEQMNLQVVSNTVGGMTRAINAREIETIHDEGLPVLECGCPMVMVVDYDNMGSDEAQTNNRASVFFQHRVIRGDAYLVGMGEVKTARDTDPDFISLTPQFHDWEGPGHPVPQGKMPWQS